MNVKLFLCLNGNNVAYVAGLIFTVLPPRMYWAAEAVSQLIFLEKRTEGTEKGLMMDSYYISGGNVN